MKARSVLLAELHKRDLGEESAKIAERHHVTLGEVCEPSHKAEVVKARHAIWAWQVRELGSVPAVCRIWGVDRSSMLAADLDAKSPIAFVLLDSFRHAGQDYRFAYFGDRRERFWIAVVTPPGQRPEDYSSRSYATYDSAHIVWRQLQEIAGQTFRAVSNGSNGAAPVAQLEGGR